MDFEKVDLKTLGRLLPNKETLYRFMTNQGFYLPSRNAKVVSEDYLVNCLNGKYFTIKVSQLKPFTGTKLGQVTKLIQELAKIADKPLGFDINHLPDKNWVINVLHSLDENNSVFHQIKSSPFTRMVPKGFIENIPLPEGLIKKRSVFQLSKKEREQLKFIKKKNQILRKKEKVDLLLERLKGEMREIKIMEKELQDMQNLQNESDKEEKSSVESPEIEEELQKLTKILNSTDREKKSTLVESQEMEKENQILEILQKPIQETQSCSVEILEMEKELQNMRDQQTSSVESQNCEDENESDSAKNLFS